MTNKTSAVSLFPTIDAKKKAIVMTKKFANASSRVGSYEYDVLQQVRKDYPTYRLVIKNAKKNVNIKNVLNYDFMERYIKKHDESKLDDFNLRTTKIEGIGSESFVNVKDWFLTNFPEVADYKTLRDALLAA